MKFKEILNLQLFLHLDVLKTKCCFNYVSFEMTLDKEKNSLKT